jgi:hypothetical protein
MSFTTRFSTFGCVRLAALHEARSILAADVPEKARVVSLALGGESPLSHH